MSFRSLVGTSPGLSIFRQTKEFQQVVFTRGCGVRDRVLEMCWRRRPFVLCSVLLAPAPSREGMTRRWVLSLFTFARHHLQSKMPRRENCTRKVTFS